MIDVLVIEYRETKNELVFNEIYRELIDKQRKNFPQSRDLSIQMKQT